MRLLAGVYELGPEPAVSVGARGLTYGELREAAAAVARELEGASRVAVWAEPTLEAVVASVAALCAGVTLVPVNPQLGRGELEHVLGDSRPDVVVGAPDLPAAARRVTVDVSARGGELPEPTAEGDEGPALIVYTSGTTGRPKGAVLPRRAIASNLDALADAWAWTAGDVLAHGLPLFHVHGLVLGLLGPIRLGGGLRHVGRFTPESVAAALADSGTMLFGVPTMYHRLADPCGADGEVRRALAGARLLVSGSAALPAREHTRIERATGQHVVERYGLTETLINTSIPASGERR
ncbi:MAG: AMP-binding protein, partial [Solirubrobacteraceae bacterium]